jgi:hypothetical protein
MVYKKIKEYKDYLIRFTIPKKGFKKYKAEVFNLNGERIFTAQFGDRRYQQYKDKIGERIFTAQFGDRRYQQYKDKIGYYSDLDHNDKKRLQRYRNRHEEIRNKDGVPAYKVEFSPAWFSYLYLW